MKYFSIFAGLVLIALLVMAVVSKRDSTTAPTQTISVSTTNTPITVEGTADVAFPTRK